MKGAVARARPRAHHAARTPHASRPRIARALAMLRGKTVETPARKHDNLPL
jgi:hypothetical protein